MNKPKAQIGIFGGSFNPFHLGHMSCLLQVQELLKLDKIIVIPTSRSPFKNMAEELNVDCRLEMVKIGV